jgi:hypothetical protein
VQNFRVMLGMIFQRPEMTNQSHQLGARWVNQANPDSCRLFPLDLDRENPVVHAVMIPGGKVLAKEARK